MYYIWCLRISFLKNKLSIAEYFELSINPQIIQECLLWNSLNLSLILQARKLDENGNPTPSSGCSSSCNNSVSYTARQLKPLSIYRHNPAFHSQHVSVNQMDEIPPLSPTALQPTVPLKEENNRVIPAAKARRKKKVQIDLFFDTLTSQR